MSKALKNGIATVIVAVIILLYATGRLDKQKTGDLGRQVFYRMRGLTGGLGERRIPVGSSSGASRCRDNLREIERAKRRAAADASIATGEVSIESVARALGGSLPRCPDGGEYFIGPLGSLPGCSIGTNGNTDAFDDHIITTY